MQEIWSVVVSENVVAATIIAFLVSITTVWATFKQVRESARSAERSMEKQHLEHVQVIQFESWRQKTGMITSAAEEVIQAMEASVRPVVAVLWSSSAKNYYSLKPDPRSVNAAVEAMKPARMRTLVFTQLYFDSLDNQRKEIDNLLGNISENLWNMTREGDPDKYRILAESASDQALQLNEKIIDFREEVIKVAREYTDALKPSARS